MRLYGKVAFMSGARLSDRHTLMKAGFLFLILICPAVAGEPPIRTVEPDKDKPHPFLAEGKSGMVVGLTGQQAVHAGFEVLKQDGSAVDAAMATAMTQIVGAAGSYISFAGILTMTYY